MVDYSMEDFRALSPEGGIYKAETLKNSATPAIREDFEVFQHALS